MIEYYEVRILVRHPTLSKEGLMALFGDQPNHAASVGERGAYSFWSTIDRVTGQRGFSHGVTRALDWLEQRSRALIEVQGGGGTIEVILQFPGDRNIGDTVGAGELARAGKLGVSLGVEVFPLMNSAPRPA